jgi:uncharacterized protein with NAD-binding domain and iron-sulfur cluster
VFDNLVSASHLLVARRGADLVLPLDVPSSPHAYTTSEVLQAPIALLQLDPLSAASSRLANRLAVFLSSCDARRLGEWENVAWTDFIGASADSNDLMGLLADLPRIVQASHGDRASTNWVAGVVEALIYNILGRGATGPFDRPLNGPTNEAWIGPWLELLRKFGTQLRLGYTLERFEFDRGRIAGGRVHGPTGTRTVQADWYVCALPVERARSLWDKAMLAADPRLQGMYSLETGWMNGIQFYLRRPTPIANGHEGYFRAPWALSSVSQGQFWKGDFAATYGDGQVHDCLSAIISDWFRPGLIYGKPAHVLKPDQVAHEVWETIKLYLNDSGTVQLSDDLLHSWALDPGLTYKATGFANADPLTVPTIGTWSMRPPAGTAIPNLVLSGDYGSGHWLVGTMESANTAGRLAANEILHRAGSPETPATVFDHYRPPEWEPLKKIDERRYANGQPNLFDIDATPDQLNALLKQTGQLAGIPLP